MPYKVIATFGPATLAQAVTKSEGLKIPLAPFRESAISTSSSRPGDEIRASCLPPALFLIVGDLSKAWAAFVPPVLVRWPDYSGVNDVRRLSVSTVYTVTDRAGVRHRGRKSEVG